ncbi:MAG: LptF/LptG family permease, partial [Planctomycetota bacterium]|nr:LptF/LptG family permease [Planctomycetota bacterium]
MAEVTETNQRRTSLSWTLDLYVLRLFAVLYAGNLLCLTLIYVCIDAVENLDDFSARTSTVGQLASLALRYYLAIVPVVFCQLLGPVVALTAGLFTVTLFHQSNEFVPMLSAGRPHWRIFLPILAGAVGVSLGTFLLQELWIPRTAATVREVRGKKKGMEVLLHRKHLDLKSGVLIKINRYHVLERRAEGVTVLPLMPAGGRSDAREYLIQAREMLWVEPELQKKSPYWLLKDGQLQTYDEEGRLIPPPAPDA